FEQNVVEASLRVPVVVDFWAPWCGPCRTLGPVLERLVHARGGKVLLAKVNTDEAPALAEYFQISAIPSVKVIHQGQIVHEFQGVQPEEALRQLLDQLTAGPAESPLARAQALEADQPQEAERLYRQLLEENADGMAARVGLARVLLALNRPDEVEDLL